MSFEIEVEHKFEIRTGQRSGLQFGEVESECGELVEYTVQRTRLVRQSHHYADFACGRKDLQIFAYADKPCVVGVVVLNVAVQYAEVVKVGAVAATAVLGHAVIFTSFANFCKYSAH